MLTNEQNPEKSPPKEPEASDNGEKIESMFSPGFRSVAAMAGWDEEAILVASLVVEDTPDRDFKQKKRSDLPFKTPPSNSRRYPVLSFFTEIHANSVLRFLSSDVFN